MSGEERENTQHIQIKYLTPDITTKEKKKREKEAGIKTPRGLVSARGDHTFRGSLTARSTQGDLLQVPGFERKAGSFKEKGRREKKHSPRRSSLDEETFRDVLDEGDEHSPSESDQKVKKKNKKKKKDDSSSLSSQSKSTLTSNLATTMQNRYSSSKYDRIKHLPRRLPDPSDEWDEDGEYIDKRKKEPLKLKYSAGGELRLALEQLEEQDDDSVEDSEEDFDDGSSNKGKGVRLKSSTSATRKVSTSSTGSGKR